MACLTIPAQGKTIRETNEIRATLAPLGIYYEQWNVDRGVSPDASADEILAAYAPEIEALKARGGYVTADVINVTAETPGLDEMLNRFNKEHTHSEDEVRFIVKGRGLFFFHPADGGPVLSLEVEAGDLINVPTGTRHWFDLCQERSIRAIRLFQDKAGWTPEYINDGVHGAYQPVCWAPHEIAGEPTKPNSAVRV